MYYQPSQTNFTFEQPKNLVKEQDLLSPSNPSFNFFRSDSPNVLRNISFSNSSPQQSPRIQSNGHQYVTFETTFSNASSRSHSPFMTNYSTDRTPSPFVNYNGTSSDASPFTGGRSSPSPARLINPLRGAFLLSSPMSSPPQSPRVSAHDRVDSSFLMKISPEKQQPQKQKIQAPQQMKVAFTSFKPVGIEAFSSFLNVPLPALSKGLQAPTAPAVTNMTNVNSFSGDMNVNMVNMVNMVNLAPNPPMNDSYLLGRRNSSNMNVDLEMENKRRKKSMTSAPVSMSPNYEHVYQLNDKLQKLHASGNLS